VRVAGLGALGLALAACTKEGDGKTPAYRWEILADDLPAAVLAIAGTSVDDLWVVGSDAGKGPLVLHHSSNGWATLETGTSGDLWGAWTDGKTGTFVGSGGLVVEELAGGFDWTELDPAVTLFGVWRADDGEAWAVGGGTAPDSAVIYRSLPGESWTEATIPAEAAAQSAILSVWGRSGGEVYASGTGGVLLAWDGTVWSLVESGTDQPLASVHGDEQVYAVGGDESGVVVAEAGGAWAEDAAGVALPPLRGAFVRDGCDAAAAGNGGQVAWKRSGGWEVDERPIDTLWDFRAIWVSPDCEALAVGGALDTTPLHDGVVAWAGGEGLGALP
jgi:hypothetical protein